jgi:hypothetical protein
MRTRTPAHTLLTSNEANLRTNKTSNEKQNTKRTTKANLGEGICYLVFGMWSGDLVFGMRYVE